MNAIADGRRGTFAGIVALAVLMILFAMLVAGMGPGKPGSVAPPHRDSQAARLSALSASPRDEAAPAGAAAMPMRLALGPSSPAVSPLVPAAKARPAKPREAAATSAPRLNLASVQVAPDLRRADLIEAFAPPIPKPAEAIAPAAHDAAVPELARATADGPAATPVAVGPALALAPVAVQHDAVQRGDAPQPGVATAQIEHVSDVQVLTDEQLAGVGAASDSVAMGDHLPGV